MFAKWAVLLVVAFDGSRWLEDPSYRVRISNDSSIDATPVGGSESSTIHEFMRLVGLSGCNRVELAAAAERDGHYRGRPPPDLRLRVPGIDAVWDIYPGPSSSHTVQSEETLTDPLSHRDAVRTMERVCADLLANVPREWHRKLEHALDLLSGAEADPSREFIVVGSSAVRQRLLDAALYVDGLGLSGPGTLSDAIPPPGDLYYELVDAVVQAYVAKSRP